ncbi:Clp protease N-terminal domain-containing protein [Pseudonocardia spirodelae]|uniref:Clp protease N-terminal domain-containing protein n=1 Tax=Pseudonocardia spirodelae TaxID=3133431 RepID=UPI003BF599FA
MSTDPPPVTPRLREILCRAEELAREHAGDVLGIEHVVLAALEDERSVPAQVLGQRADLAVLRGDLEHVMRSPGYRANL